MSRSIARALLFSGVAVSLAVALWLRQHEAADEQGLESTLAQKQRLFSPLCFDPAVTDQVRFEDRGAAVELRLKDRWRDAEQRVIEDRKLEVILATLRTTRAERLDGSVVPSDLGLEPPRHALELESSQHNRRCRVELGAKHPLDDRVVFRRIDGDETLVGWAKYSATNERLIELKGLAAETVLPLRSGDIDRLEVEPQVGMVPYEVRRIPGAFMLSNEQLQQRADQELIAELLDRLVSLKGELEETDRKLSDPDWIVRVHNGPLSVRLAFFRSADGLWIASDELVFRARQSDLSWLVKPAKAWRDLRLTYYERGEVRRVEIADGTGRTFVYRRQPDAQGGLDRWFHHDRALKDTHLLSGLQWDLHRLRGRAIVDELTTLECGEQCARIKMIDVRDKVLVDVALDRRASDVLIQRSKGPVMVIDQQAVENWPFTALN
ncbi:MAG: hypothetical protein VYB65_07665 [Myxococcota bacterium]|nr:hypothetical protein [Myxococcota bacterium]